MEEVSVDDGGISRSITVFRPSDWAFAIALSQTPLMISERTLRVEAEVLIWDFSLIYFLIFEATTKRSLINFLLKFDCCRDIAILEWIAKEKFMLSEVEA